MTDEAVINQKSIGDAANEHDRRYPIIEATPDPRLQLWHERFAAHQKEGKEFHFSQVSLAK